MDSTLCSTDWNHLLNTDTYLHILENIFNFLPSRTLQRSCQPVNEFWKAVVEKILNRRCALVYGVYGLASNRRKEAKLLSTRFKELWSAPAMVITFSGPEQGGFPDPGTDSESESEEDRESSDEGPSRKRRRIVANGKLIDSLVNLFVKENSGLSLPSSSNVTMKNSTTDNALPSEAGDPNSKRKEKNLVSSPSNSAAPPQPEQSMSSLSPSVASSHERLPSEETLWSTISTSHPSTSRETGALRAPSITKSVDTDLFCVSGSGCVGTDEDGLVHEFEEGEYFSYLVLPLMPSSQFSLRAHKIKYRNVYDVPRLDDAKVLLVFTDFQKRIVDDTFERTYPGPSAGNLAQKALQDFFRVVDKKCVVAGGIVNSTEYIGVSRIKEVPLPFTDFRKRSPFFHFDPEDFDRSRSPDDKLTSSMMFHCLAFGGKGVKAASVVIPPDANRIVTETKLLLLRRSGVVPNLLSSSSPGVSSSTCSPSVSFAFMFICEAKGTHRFKQANVEANLFRKAFPGVPLVGFFASGEIGYDYAPQYTNEYEKDKIKVKDLGKRMRRQDPIRSYTTIIVVINVSTR